MPTVSIGVIVERVELSEGQRAELRALLADPATGVDIGSRARIVLWRADGLTRGEVASRAGVSLPTVDRWVKRFAQHGADGLITRTAAHPQVSEQVRDHVLALARTDPRPATGLSRWTTRALADYLRTTESITVSHNYVANLVRAENLQWTNPTAASEQARRSRQPEPLDVRVEVAVVDGPHTQTLRDRQTQAIRDILRWFREHPEEP